MKQSKYIFNIVMSLAVNEVAWHGLVFNWSPAYKLHFTWQSVFGESAVIIHPGEAKRPEARSCAHHRRRYGGSKRSVRRDPNHPAVSQSSIRHELVWVLQRARKSREWCDQSCKCSGGPCVTVRAALRAMLPLRGTEDPVYTETDGLMTRFTWLLRSRTWGAFHIPRLHPEQRIEEIKPNHTKRNGTDISFKACLSIFFPPVIFFRFCFWNSDIFRHICSKPSSVGLIPVKLSHFPLALCQSHIVVFSLAEYVRPSPLYWLIPADKNRFMSQWSCVCACVCPISTINIRQ